MPPDTHASTAPETPLLSVVIVTYNTRDMTIACLRSLYADLEGIPAEVFVVDNASTDSTAEAIHDRYPSVELIANTENLGFGAANNQAMRRARGQFHLLLNSDAFPEKGAIPSLLREIQADPKIGVLGPRLFNRDGSLQISCFKFPSPFRAWVENLWISAVFSRHPTIGDYRRWPHDSPRDVDWIIGACMMVRAEVFKQVGGFDERFFMYVEESDWQRRIRDAGWTIRFTPFAGVTHLAGASGASGNGGAAAPLPRINRHMFQSLDYYERKHHGLMGLIALRTAMVIGCVLRMVAWSCVFIIQPKRRQLAAAKVRLLSWLVYRQSTCWQIHA